MAQRVTMADVAQEAGVSLMTVSRVINDKGEVSAATRQRILDIIERMGYRPSGIARGLATQHTGTLGLVVPDISNPFFSEVTRGAEHEAYAAGYNVFLCNTEEETGRELAVLQSLEEKRVDGVVLCSSRLDNADLGKALAQHPAVVLANRRLEPPDGGNAVGVVVLADMAGGQMATQYLIDSGHQELGFLAGPSASHSGRLRAQGYYAALAAAELAFNPEWMRHCTPTVQGGREIARELLIAQPELTALFCYNDLVAVGALQACADLERRVPDDLAVVGFDDIPLAALVTPPLTTCRTPRYELGANAMRLLLDHIEECSGDCADIVLHPELMVRSSAP